ncbi:MAG: translation initiation factor IF-3 [Hyphomonas sp.]|jgi:translation initiation factor IF-3
MTSGSPCGRLDCCPLDFTCDRAQPKRLVELANEWHIPQAYEQPQRRQAIARRPDQGGPQKQVGPRTNEDITATNVLLIDENGEKQGVMPLAAALDAAREASMDLVEVSPDQEVPVVKILDYGKLRFEERKKKAAAKKKQRSSELKEIKMRPNIDTHDYEVKSRAMQRFFEDGDKVKVTLRFRGREMAHQHLGMQLLERVKTQFEETTKVETEPKLEGRQMTMVLAPR